MTKRPFALCRLCNQEAELCRSHIVPEWMHAKARDGAGKFISASRHPHHRPKPFQTGRWEHLLCKECEGRLSSVENRAKASVNRILEAKSSGGSTVSVPGADPSLLLFFGWSILWRASVSSDFAFEGVSLGEFEEELRVDLLAGALEPARYPMLILRPDGSEAFARSLLLPHAFDLFGLQAYRMSGFGLWWVWSTSTRRAVWLREASTIPWIGLDPVLTAILHETDDDEFFRQMRELVNEGDFL